MKVKGNVRRIVEIGIGSVAITTLLLAGCGGGGGAGGGGQTATPSGAIRITPMKGKFSAGTAVKVKRSKDGVVVATGATDAAGVATIIVPTSEAGPLLVEVGAVGDSYFDESVGTNASIPAGGAGLRALIPDRSANDVGVTALTEMAVGQIEAASGGIAAATATDVVATNVTVGNSFGIDDVLDAPSIIGNGTQLDTAGGGADRHALTLAALAKLATAGKSALDVAHDLRDDAKDGTLDGRINTTPIASIDPAKLAIGTGGASPASMVAAINTEIATAKATYAPSAIDVAPVLDALITDMATTAAAARIQAASGGASGSVLREQIQSFNAEVFQNIAAGVSAASAVAAVSAADRPTISMSPVSRGAWAVADAGVPVCADPINFVGCQQTTVTANWTAPAGVVVTNMDLIPVCTHGREAPKTVAVAGGSTTATIGWYRGVGQGLCPGWYNGPAKMRIVLTYTVNGGAPMKLVHNYNSDDVPIVSYSPANFAAWSAARSALAKGQTTSLTVNWSASAGTVVTGMTLESGCKDGTYSNKAGVVGQGSATVSWQVGMGQGVCPGLLPDGVTKNYAVHMVVRLDYTVNGQPRQMARRY